MWGGGTVTPYSYSLLDNSIAGKGGACLPLQAPLGWRAPLLSPSGRCYPDLSWPPPWASQGSPADLEPVLVLQASAWGPGVEFLSLAPKGQAGCEVMPMDTVGATTQGSWAKVVHRGEMQESNGFAPGGLGGSFTRHLPRGCLSSNARAWGPKPGYYRME